MTARALAALGSVDLDEAVVAVCAAWPEYLARVLPQWLLTPALRVLLGAMRRIHLRGEHVDIDAVSVELAGREHETHGGWWTDWVDWWVVADPVGTGLRIACPDDVIAMARDCASRRMLRDAYLVAAAACETGDLGDLARAHRRAAAFAERMVRAAMGSRVRAA